MHFGGRSLRLRLLLCLRLVLRGLRRRQRLCVGRGRGQRGCWHGTDTAGGMDVSSRRKCRSRARVPAQLAAGPQRSGRGRCPPTPPPQPTTEQGGVGSLRLEWSSTQQFTWQFERTRYLRGQVLLVLVRIVLHLLRNVDLWHGGGNVSEESSGPGKAESGEEGWFYRRRKASHASIARRSRRYSSSSPSLRRCLCPT